MTQMKSTDQPEQNEILECVNCHKRTTRAEAEDRNIKTGFCGYCGNRLEPVDAQAEAGLREKLLDTMGIEKHEDDNGITYTYVLGQGDVEWTGDIQLDHVDYMLDNLTALFQADKSAAVVEALNRLYEDRYLITVNPQFSIFVVNANSIKEMMFRLQPPTAGEGESV